MALNLTFWDNQQNPVNTTVDRIMDALRNDDMREGLIYEPCTMDDVLDGTQSAEALIMDAIVSQYSKLTAKMNIMQRAMTRSGATVDGINEKGEKIDIPLTVIGYQISDPFMRLGTANVVALFELSDGQTVSIYFHNPDTTPKKITAQDEVISFKWLLNKKDITIVVAPERGKDINALQVAMRIMKIAAKNSAAFTRQNKNRAERLAKVTALRELVAEKEKILAQKMKKIDELKYLKSQEELDRLDEEDRLMKGEITASLYQELKERNRLEDRQDELDNLFNGRILVIRSALQKEGWNGELYKELNKEGIYLKTEWETTKDTGNTLGMSYHISEVDFHYVDDLTDKPEEIAQKINAVIQPLLAKLLAEQKASAQTDKKDDEEQPIIITGKEFGEFDTSTPEGKATLREKAFEHLKGLAEHNEMVFCNALNADIEFTVSGAKKYKKFSGNPIKSKLAIKIKELIAGGKVFKESEERYDQTEQGNKLTYHYLKNSAFVDEQEYGVRMVIREDSNGHFHYDLQINDDGIDAILDSINENNAILLPVTRRGLYGVNSAQSELHFDSTTILDNAQVENINHAFEYAKTLNSNLTLHLDDTNLAISELENALQVVETNAPINEKEGNLEQAQLERHCAKSFKEAISILKKPILDDVGEGRYVLNLFVFDKDGNEIKDEEEPELTGEEHQDKENYEKMLEDKANRKRSMSEEMKAEFTAFLRQYGFDEHHLADIPVGSTSFYVGKEQNGLKIDIEAAFTNSQVERHQDAYYDFTVTGDKTALVGEEADDRYAYFYTNNFEDALKWANEWLDKNKGELMQTTEPTQEQADRQFLQDIIDRKIDVLADDFYDKLEPIANRVYTYDEELLKKAIDNYATITDEYAVATE